MAIHMSRMDELALITLDRPEALNALSFALLDDLSRQLDSIASGNTRALLGVGGQTAGADELASRLEALASPSRVERLVAQHRARIAEAQWKGPVMQLGRDHASHTHGALAHEREQRSIRVHEAEEGRLLRTADACSDRVQRLDQRGDHEAVTPCLEGLDEPIGEHPAAAGRPHEVIGESIGAPANRCAGRQRVEACHAGILRATRD